MSESKKSWLYIIIVFLFAFGLYSPSIGYEFTYDDTVQVEGNEYVQNPDKSLNQIISTFAKPTIPGDLYRPIVMLSLRLNFLISEYDAWSFHLFNVLLHSIISIMVFLLARTFNIKPLLCLISALIFAAHPIHMEAIANVYNRTELLACFFSLLTIFCFLKYWKNKEFYLLYAACLFLLLGSLSKESALTSIALAPLCLLYLHKLSFSRENTIKIACSTFPMLITAFIYLGLRARVLQSKFLITAPVKDLYYVENPLFHFDFIERIIPSLYIFGEYLRLLFLPLSFSVDYSLPYKYFEQFIYSSFGITAIGLSLIFLFSLLLIRKKQSLLWGLWIVISFSLTLNFIVPIGTFMAERLAYLPSVGFCILIVKLLSEYKTTISKFFYVSITIAYLSLLSFKTYTRLPIWKDNFILFEQAMLENSVSPKVAFNLGLKYYDAKEYKLCADAFREGIMRDPTRNLTGKHLIKCYLESEQYGKAAYWAKKYLEVEPNDQEIIKLVEYMEELGLFVK